MVVKIDMSFIPVDLKRTLLKSFDENGILGGQTDYNENLIMFKSSKFTGPDPENPDGASYANPYIRPQVFKAGVEVSF